MVLLYMNRFIIDEKSQHEISGVYQLAAEGDDIICRIIQKVVPVTIPWFRSKQQKDLNIIHDALIKDPS